MTSEHRPSDFDNEVDLTDDPRVVEVVEEYLRELEAGRKPERETYLLRYPELKAAVAQCLEGLDIMQSGLDSYGPAKGTPPVLQATQGLELGPAPLGDFQIVSEIARGGMGVVYEAVQLSLNRRVALKVLPFAATVNERQLHRFKNEAQAAALLHHTHIVPIYAVGCERGVHFYAMQLIGGQSLAVVIQQLREREGLDAEKNAADSNSPESTIDLASTQNRRHAKTVAAQAQRSTVDVTATLSSDAKRNTEGFLRRVCRLMSQAAGALEHAHQEGVIHRDVKPGNLLLDTTGNLWVTDFGLAILQAQNGLTRSGDMLGTFRYMSPEQAGGQRTLLDHRTDIYSLGATFYELLTLQPVFDGETHQELLYQILHVEPRSPRHHNPAIPVELETILLKSLSKNPADRYATIGEMGKDIERYLNHQPILARPPTIVDRARKWIRRHPAAVVTTLLVLLLITGLSLISNRRIAYEQQQTRAALDREKERAQEAEERFQQAREAVDTLFQISEEELSDRPNENARRRILEVVLSYYQDFIEERAGDQAAQQELVRVQAKVKTILNEISVVKREMQMRLLASPAVRDELGLSSDGELQLVALLGEWSEQRDALMEELSELNDDERRSRLFAIASQHEHELDEILTVAQVKRFRQLAVQSQGIFAFKDPDIVRALALTSEQRRSIRDIERELFHSHMRNDRGPPDSKRRDGPRSGPPEGPPPDLHSSPDVMKSVLALLSDEQLSQWKNLTGEPFTGFPGKGFGGPFGPPPPR